MNFKQKQFVFIDQELLSELENTDPNNICFVALELCKNCPICINYDQALESMLIVDKIFEKFLPLNRKDLCKIKRAISILLIKTKRAKESLEVLKQIEVSLNRLLKKKSLDLKV